MKAYHALPLVMLSLFAFAAPSQAESFRFRQAEDQLYDVLSAFDFDTMELESSDEGAVSYYLEHQGVILHAMAFDNGCVAYTALWENERGMDEETVEFVNQWNFDKWYTKVAFQPDGSYMLMMVLPAEMNPTLVDAEDMLALFLSDMQHFHDSRP